MQGALVYLIFLPYILSKKFHQWKILQLMKFRYRFPHLLFSEVKSIEYSRQKYSDYDVEKEYWENSDFEDRGAFYIFDEINDEDELI